MLKQLVDRLTTVPLVGVDVGSSWIKVVELARTPAGLSLRRCAVAPTNGADATVALRRTLDEAGIASSRASLGLSEAGVAVRPFQFPPMPKKELASAIQLEAEQAILNGHALKEMAIDWYTLSHSAEGIRGLLAVVPKKVLSNRLQLARAAGLRPTVVDVESLALWNAYWVLVGSSEPAPKTVLLMNIGAKTTNVVIAKGPDELTLVRDFPLGAKALEQGHQDEWNAEVRDSLAYARSKGGLRLLDAVYVTGGGSGPTLIPLLRAAVPAPATFWNPLQHLVRDEGSPAVNETIGPLLTIAIGLALRRL